MEITPGAENRLRQTKLKKQLLHNKIKAQHLFFSMFRASCLSVQKYRYTNPFYGNRILIIIQRPPLNETVNWKGKITHSRCWNNNSVKLNFDAFYSGKESVRKQQH